MRPIVHADGHDFPGHIDELVPSETVVENVVVAVRDPKIMGYGAIASKLGCKKARTDFLMSRERQPKGVSEYFSAFAG